MERSRRQKIDLRYPLPETSSGRAVTTRACAAQQVRQVVESVVVKAEYLRRRVRGGRERGGAVDVASASECFLQRPHAHKEPEGRQAVGGRRRVRREGVWVGRSGGPESGRERPRDAEFQSPKVPQDARQTMPTEGAGLCSGWRGGGAGPSKKQSTRVSGRGGRKRGVENVWAPLVWWLAWLGGIWEMGVLGFWEKEDQKGNPTKNGMQYPGFLERLGTTSKSGGRGRERQGNDKGTTRERQGVGLGGGVVLVWKK